MTLLNLSMFFQVSNWSSLLTYTLHLAFGICEYHVVLLLYAAHYARTNA